MLTPAEWRVLAHVRQGRTNAEIAVQLQCSPNTVKTHVASMFAKLALTNRHALAAWDGEAATETERRVLGLGSLVPLLWSVTRGKAAWGAKAATITVAAGGVLAGAMVIGLIVADGPGQGASDPVALAPPEQEALIVAPLDAAPPPAEAAVAAADATSSAESGSSAADGTEVVTWRVTEDGSLLGGGGSYGSITTALVQVEAVEAEMIATILGDAVLRAQLLNNLSLMAEELGITEILISSPTLSADQSELYPRFLDELRALLRRSGVNVDVALFEQA